MIEPVHYPLLIAGATVTAGAVWWLVRVAWVQWDENRDRRLSAAIDLRLKGYVTTEALEMQLNDLRDHTDELHQQNERNFDTIRTEGHKREGMILAALESAARERREDAKEIRESVGEVHKRVDQVLVLSGERRGRS